MARMALLSVLSLAFVACSVAKPVAVPQETVSGLLESGNTALLSALSDPEASFATFLQSHGKQYASGTERLYRQRVFEANLLRAVENQLNDPTAVHGVTRFADLTEEEFATKFLGLKQPGGLGDHPKAPLLPTDSLPEDFDWREKGAVTPVKNQGMCGSCYAFSAVGALEGAHYLSTGELVRLSEQQVVDCDSQCDPSYYDVCDSGCQGGLMNNVFNYAIKAGGLVAEESYPYTGQEGTCKVTKQSKFLASVKSYQVVTTEEKQIEANLVKYGPLAVAINAAWMQTYIKGVSCPIVCNKRALNHGVLLVGYGAAELAPSRFKKMPYWIIKNSWGPVWGEEGYYKVCNGKNMCGVESMVSSVVAATLDNLTADEASADVATVGVATE